MDVREALVVKQRNAFKLCLLALHRSIMLKLMLAVPLFPYRAGFLRRKEYSAPKRLPWALVPFGCFALLKALALCCCFGPLCLGRFDASCGSGAPSHTALSRPLALSFVIA